MVLVNLVSGCTLEEATTHSEEIWYTIGEKIVINDNESNAKLGELIITDVSIISEEPLLKNKAIRMKNNYRK